MCVTIISKGSGQYGKRAGGRGLRTGAAVSNADPRPLHLIDFVMWTQIKEAHGFRGHVGAIVAQEDLVVAFLSAYTAIAVNDEKIF
jgi:hypothetical protein